MNVFAIVITYNGKSWIQKCIHSLLNATRPLSIIIIDNGSEDGTQEFILQHPEIDFIQLKENVGFGQANNIGIKKAYEAGGDFFFLLNQDAWVEPDTIRQLVTKQIAEPRFGIVSPMHLNGKGDALDTVFSHWLAPVYCPGFVSDTFLHQANDNLYEIKFVNAAAWLMSRKCIETVGGFNPLFFQYGEDDNYVHRCHYHGFKVGIVAHARMFHDRAERKSSAFFDHLQYQKRLRLLDYCNPNQQVDIEADLLKYKRRLRKHSLKLEFRKFKETNREIRTLKTLSQIVQHDLVKTKSKGLTFL